MVVPENKKHFKHYEMQHTYFVATRQIIMSHMWKMLLSSAGVKVAVLYCISRRNFQQASKSLTFMLFLRGKAGWGVETAVLRSSCSCENVNLLAANLAPAREYCRLACIVHRSLCCSSSLYEYGSRDDSSSSCKSIQELISCIRPEA